MSDTIRITVRNDGAEGSIQTFEGRCAWALDQLIAAGDSGCTPITHPGPRWSDYTFKLRRAGIEIETVTESHNGPFAGHHARYVLRSPLIVLGAERAGGTS